MSKVYAQNTLRVGGCRVGRAISRTYNCTLDDRSRLLIYNKEYCFIGEKQQEAADPGIFFNIFLKYYTATASGVV